MLPEARPSGLLTCLRAGPGRPNPRWGDSELERCRQNAVNVTTQCLASGLPQAVCQALGNEQLALCEGGIISGIRACRRACQDQAAVLLQGGSGGVDGASLAMAADACSTCIQTNAASCQPGPGYGPPGTALQSQCRTCVAGLCGNACSQTPAAIAFCANRSITRVPPARPGRWWIPAVDWWFGAIAGQNGTVSVM